MSNPAAIGDMIDMTMAEFGRLDILVNNAGIQFVAPLQEFPTAKWDAILAINLSSAFHTTRLVLPRMVENKWGRIVNIASAHGLVASPFKSAYVAAKHGIVGLTKVTALETAEQGSLQCDLPRIRLHAAGRSPDRRPSEGAQHSTRTGHSRRAAGPAAEQALCNRRGVGRLDGVSRLRGGCLDHRRRPAGRRRLDRRSMAPSVVSVTPTAANFTGSRASGFILSAGQLPAALVAKVADPMARPATAIVRPKRRPSPRRWDICVGS
jgi:hypothetical protein